MKSNNLLAIAALAAFAMPGFDAEVIPRDYYPTPTPRRSEHRKGRRSNYGFDVSPADRNGHHPAGSKFAKQARKGTLTLSRIR